MVDSIDLCILGDEANGDAVESIDETHPEVQQAMQTAEERVRSSPPEPTTKLCIDALSKGIADAELKRNNSKEDERK